MQYMNIITPCNAYTIQCHVLLHLDTAAAAGKHANQCLLLPPTVLPGTTCGCQQ